MKDRVELITPIDEPDIRRRLITLLNKALEDNRLAWELDSEGRYRLRGLADGEPERNFHELLMKQAHKRAKQARLP